MLTMIKEGLDRRNKFNDAVDKVSDGFFICNIGEEFLEVSLKLLGSSVKDYKEDSIIEWWLFEDVEKYIYLAPSHVNNPTDEELKVSVQTPEELYTYFKNYH
jgi:hypothetical protein